MTTRELAEKIETMLGRTGYRHDLESLLSSVLEEAKQEAYEGCAQIAKNVAERELEISKGYKGHMIFQSQSYIDAAIEIEEQIRQRAQKVCK